jgi:hypothetical protein
MSDEPTKRDDAMPEEDSSPDTAETAARRPATSTSKDASAQRPGRAPSPEAAAARRARRIGGRPVAGSSTRPGEDAKEASTEAAPRPAKAKTPAKTPTPAKAQAKTQAKVTPKSPAKAQAATAADPGADPALARQVPGWLVWLPGAVLTAAALAMVVLMVIFSHGVWWGPDAGRGPDQKTVNALRQQVLAASKSCLAQTNTYDYTKLDDYEKSALTCATGQFANQLKQTIETLVKVNAPKLKAKQTAQINKGGIETVSADGSQWTVLLFGQLSVVNTTDPKGRTDPFAAQVQMEKVRGTWLISQLKTVSSPLG